MTRTDPVDVAEVAAALTDIDVRRAAVIGLAPDVGRWIEQISSNPGAVRRVPVDWLTVVHLCLDADASEAACRADTRVSASAAASEAHCRRPVQMLSLCDAPPWQVWEAARANPQELLALLEETPDTALNAAQVDAIVGGWCDAHQGGRDNRGHDALEEKVAEMVAQRLHGALGDIYPTPAGELCHDNVVDCLVAAGRTDLLEKGGPIGANELAPLTWSMMAPAQFAAVLDRGLQPGAEAVLDEPVLYDHTPALRALCWERLGNVERFLAEMDAAIYTDLWFDVAELVIPQLATEVLVRLVDQSPLFDNLEYAPRTLALAERIGVSPGWAAQVLSDEALGAFAESVDVEVVHDYLRAAGAAGATALVWQLNASSPVRREVLRHGRALPATILDAGAGSAEMLSICTEALGADRSRWALMWSLARTWDGSLVELLDAVAACDS